MRLFSISDNSFDTRGFPWGAKVRGNMIEYYCSTCGAHCEEPSGDVSIKLERKKGSKWGDVLGDGSQSLFTVSKRVIEDWKREDIGEFPRHRATIVEPYPKKLEGTTPLEYYWIDGDLMLGAKLDFEASGFVGVFHCPECNSLKYDISATYDRQHSAVWPYAFIEGTWNGTNIYTTDISSRCFFCTEKVIECAVKYGHTNFRFTPVEEGLAISSKGLPYLKKGFSLAEGCESIRF